MRNLFKKQFRNNKGFSLIEIMIVLGILVVIIGMIASRVAGARDKAAVKQTKIRLSTIQNAITTYYGDCGGKYPASLNSLIAADADCANWGPEPYLKKNDILDDWSHEIHYELNGSEYTLKSYGKDGREGGTGYNKDITLDE